MAKEKKSKRIVVPIMGILLLGLICGYYGARLYYSHKATSERSMQSQPKAKEIEKKAEENKEDLESKKKNEENTWSNVNLKHNDKGIPILMYHSIAYEKNNEVRLPKEKFQQQMKYLKDNGYYTLTLDQAYEFFINNKPVPEKSVVLTFDDGYEDNYKDAFPILKTYGFKATIFVITAYIDKSTDYLTLAQLKEMQSNGIDIESHTVNHEYLNKISHEAQMKELKESKEFLEKALNKKINYLAYPYGKYNKDTLKIVEQLGYKMAVTTDGKWSDKTDGILTLDRVYISGAAALDVFKERISNPNYKTQE